MTAVTSFYQPNRSNPDTHNKVLRRLFVEGFVDISRVVLAYGLDKKIVRLIPDLAAILKKNVSSGFLKELDVGELQITISSDLLTIVRNSDGLGMC